MNGGIIFKQLEELLIKKAKEGVEVRISTDFIGNLQTPNSTYNRLIESGVKFSIFNKVTIPFTTGKSNNRNHDKLIVIDGKIAYTGGINFGDDYSSMYSKYGY
jgi:cardiolipin synthase